MSEAQERMSDEDLEDMRLHGQHSEHVWAFHLEDTAEEAIATRRELETQRAEITEAVHALCAAVDEDVARADPPKTVMYQMIEFAKKTRQQRDDLLDQLAASRASEARIRKAFIRPMPEGQANELGGYVCTICNWEADAIGTADFHNPTCPLGEDRAALAAAAASSQGEN